MSASLPRKFKIGFEGCAEDHTFTAINDIGWRARVREGARGFRVTVGGGTATLTRSGQELFAFLPAGEILAVAEAVVRVFHKLGDREHKHRNRMKFLIKQLGWESYRAEVERALAEVQQGPPRLPFDPDAPPEETAPAWTRPAAPSAAEAQDRVLKGALRGPGIVPEVKPRLAQIDGAFQRWIGTNVRSQKQAGYALVTVTVPLGDLTGAQLRVLADLAQAYGDGAARTTPDQDLVLRWVRATDVPDLYRRLAAAGLALPDAGAIADVTSCPGAESCRIAVTQSRGLGRLLGDHLRARPDLVAAAPDLHIKISGCPNGCGQHHIAGLGFQGGVRKVGGRAVPQYFVMVGGGVDEAGAHFARLAAKVPARRMPEALERLIALYRAERRDGESATAFFRRVDLGAVQKTLADVETLAPAEARPEDFVDLGEDAEFNPEAQEGECAA
jgi:sulfite reductase (NADPH) hemoprotein beta-component